jgi:hypothetical protein
MQRDESQLTEDEQVIRGVINLAIVLAFMFTGMVLVGFLGVFLTDLSAFKQWGTAGGLIGGALGIWLAGKR